MANISGIVENDFDALAWAANAAKKDGDITTALILDKMARKANAALSRQKYSEFEIWTTCAKRLSWKDVPSTLD